MLDRKPVAFFAASGEEKLGRQVVTAMHNLRDPNPPRLVDRQLVIAEEDRKPEAISSNVFHCTLILDDPVPLRRSGIMEVLPDVVLQFRGDPGDHRIGDILIYANTNITSRLLGVGMTEATLSMATGHCISKLPTLGRGMRAVKTAPNGLGFLEVPLHELRALPPEERNLRISNLRVNAIQLGVQENSPSQIVLYIKVSDTTVSPNPQITVATNGGHLSVRVSPASPSIDLQRLRQSQSLNTKLLTEEKQAEQLTALVKFSGNIASYEPTGERTRLLLRFNAVPPGVTLFATMEQVSAVPNTLSAKLMRGMDLQGNFPSDNSAAQKPIIDGHVGQGSIALSKIFTEAGTGLVMWEVQGRSTDEMQEITLGIVLAYHGNPSLYSPVLGSVTVNGTLAPLSTVNVASSTAPIPRFGDESISLNLFSIIA